MYTPPPAALADLDDEHRRTVSAITTNIHSVQLLHLHPGADKTATLAALADTAHHHNKHIVALTGTDSATDRAYADTTATIDTTATTSPPRATRHRWAAWSSSMIPQALTPGQLRWLAHSAAAANTKFVLIATGDQQPAHTLLAVLTNDLPNTQYLGTPDPEQRQPRTAIARAEHHLAATSAPSPDRNRAVQLMRQRNQVLAHLRDIATTARRLDVIAEQDRDRGRDQDRGTGLEL